MAAPFRNLIRDVDRLREVKEKGWPWFLIESLLFETGFQAVLFPRMAHWFKHRHIPVFGPAIARLGQFFTGVDISPGAIIGPGLRIAHGTGLVIGGGAHIGANATLMHGVTIGARRPSRRQENPTIGDSVYIGPHAGVFGPIRVGDHVFIGAGVIVIEDVPDRTKVISRAANDLTSTTCDALPAHSPAGSTAAPRGGRTF